MFILGKFWEILIYVLLFFVYMLLKIIMFLEVWFNIYFCIVFGIFIEWSFFIYLIEIWLKGNKRVIELYIYFFRIFSWYLVSWMKEFNYVLCIVYLYVFYMVENMCLNLFIFRDKEIVIIVGVVLKEWI